MKHLSAWLVFPTLILGMMLGVWFAKDMHFTIRFDSNNRPAFAEPAPSRPLSSSADLRTAIVDVAKKAGPAVVAIATTKAVERPPYPDFYRRPLPPFGDPNDEQDNPDMSPNDPGSGGPTARANYLGSGFIVSKDGYIVTNAHVVKGMDEISVELQNGKTYDAKLIGISEPYETAIIKIDAKEDLPTVSFGNSDDVQVGEWVIAIGNPLGEKYTVTQGIISAKERAFNRDLRTDVLQTDAAINRGNSGGPLLNLNGDVIGVNTAIETPNGGSVGIGFALPSNAVKYAADLLVKGGKVAVGFLGVEMQNVTADQAEAFGMKGPYGVFVSRVSPGSPADDAGVQSGDVLTQIDGNRIETSRGLRDAIARTAPGSKVRITLLREGKEQTVTVKVGSFEDANAADESTSDEVAKDAWGMKVRTLSADEAKQLKITPAKGVLVLDVAIGSPASRGGIEAGMVITKIQNEPIENTSDYQKALKKYKDNKTLQVWVKMALNYTNVYILKR